MRVGEEIELNELKMYYVKFSKNNMYVQNKSKQKQYSFVVEIKPMCHVHTKYELYY